MLKSLGSALLDFVFPPLCHVCRSFVTDAGSLHICPDCLAGMGPVPEPACTVCGIPFQGAGESHTCGACLLDPPPYEFARAALVYDGPAREMVHRLKYNYQTHLRRPLALMTANRLADFTGKWQPDLLVPVPLHVKRLRRRGFNQAVLLGEVLAREWGVPLERRAMQRIRWTEPQINLSAAERRDNVKGAFAVADPTQVAGRRVVLVDDVLTTGSTVEECSRILLRAGAARVMVVTVARALSGQ